MENRTDYPLISIIVPIYNAQKYIQNCIQSVLNQEYKNFELILIDDGSKDNSYNICKKNKDSDNRIILIHKNNEGRSVARNVGLKHAKGAYIAFLDADDSYDKQYLSKLVNLISDNNADISCCRYTRTDGNDLLTDNQKPFCNIQIYNNFEILKEYFHNVKSDIYPNIWTRLYKKELFENIQFENSEFEDLLIIHKLLAKANRMVCVDDRLYNYNTTNNNSVTNNINNIARITERIKYINEIQEQYGKTIERKNELIFHIMQQNMSICNDIKNDKNLPNEIKKNKKSIHHWINRNLSNEIFSFKDKCKIVLKVYFKKIYSFIK